MSGSAILEGHGTSDHRNVRTPDAVFGDLAAQVSSGQVASERLIATCRRYGLTDIEELSDEIMSRSEAATQAGHCRGRKMMTIPLAAPAASAVSKATEDATGLHKIDWESIPWEPVREGIVRKAFSGNGATVALHRLMPKHEPRPHKHAYEQIVYILAGHIRFHVGDKSVVLGPGGLLHIPPDVMHWGEVVGDEPVLNLDIFTPVREEYAPKP